MFTVDIQKELSTPFDDDQVGWKPQITTKGKDKQPIERNGVRVAGCTAHIDARAVMNRLDEVVGVGNWSDAYIVLPNGKNVECTLTVFGVSKSDVGEPNEGGFADSMKAAYSDALKRAAVKFGIGRYLYDMEMEWLPFDGYRVTDIPQKKKAGAKPAPADWDDFDQSPADTRGATAPDAQKARDPRNAVKKPESIFRVDDEIMIHGKNDERPGVVTAVNGEMVTVTVDGKSLTVKADKLSLVGMTT